MAPPGEAATPFPNAPELTKRYVLLMYSAEARVTGLERAARMAESLQVCDEMRAQHKLLATSALHSVLSATSLRIRDGQRELTPGPFAETTEQLEGYHLIDVSDGEEAIAIATRLASASRGTVEIRPVLDVSDLQRPDPRDIVTRRDVPFTPAQIFDVFESPDRLARWWGPDGFTNTIHDFDFRPGGEWNFTMHGPDGKNYENRMIFESIAKPRLVVLNHVCEPRFVSTMQFHPLTESTTHIHWRMRLETAEMRDRLLSLCGPANEQNLDRMTAELASL